MNRRQFNKTMSIAMLGAIAPSGCSTEDAGPSYDELVASTWRHTDGRIEKGPALLRELVRYATLAANSHNTQPWRFRLETDRITLMPDYSRRCPAADPDDHHLFASLGCATENLVLAAKAHGLDANVSLPGSSDDAVRIELESSTPADSVLFQAIPERQCTRAIYDGKPVPTSQVDELVDMAQEEGTSVQVFTDKKEMEKILEYVVAANSVQMNDAEFVQELKDWIRFNESAIVEHRDGLFSASSGNPTLPSWLGRIVLKFALSENAENDKYRDQVRSSAGVLAFVSARDDTASWVRAGRCYQRFALRSTALGLRHAFINQPVDIPEVRDQFAQYLGVEGRRPDLLLRFGYGPMMPRSVRRPVDAVLD